MTEQAPPPIGDVPARDDPAVISGIHAYCDRWCERCAWQARCDVFRSTDGLGRITRVMPDSPELTTQVARAMIASVRSTVASIRAEAKRHGIDLDLGPEACAAARADFEQQRHRTQADPLVQLGLEYARTTWPIVRVLRPIVEMQGDRRSLDAMDVIEALCGAVASKTYRAVSSAHDARYDASDVQNDANGSAKVARLAIAESRDAWKVLMEVGRARADGVPARLVRLLTDLDVGLDVRFPEAMRFVRPGFDAGRPGPAGTEPPGHTEAAAAEPPDAAAIAPANRKAGDLVLN